LPETHNNDSGITEPELTAAQPHTTAVQPPRILVLGGTGFIGRSLVNHLVQHGHGVRVLSRDPSSVKTELRHPLVEVVRGNALRMDDVRQCLKGISHVYHLVTGHGETWQDYLQSDVEATIETAKVCLEHEVERFIYAGTIASLYSGRTAGTINGQSQPDPQLETRNHYARAKGMAEQQLMQLHRDQGLPLVVLRPGIVVGEHGSPYHWGVCMWPNDTACRFWGSGQNPLPFVLVEDVAAAFVAALDAPNIVGRAFNLVGDVRLSAQEYVDELQKCSGVQFDAQPHAIWKYFAADVTKWMVKTLIRHPQRKPPSYRDWETRQELGRYDCHDVKELLHWQPNADRQRLIERGVYAPMLRALQ
ncbi:MAG: NAD(P)-dependent oxidoreductase, partial [Planctomycetales bacterium]|nr:NAD(P)-dependent oxidoreductase [Planctomycetales bacterium]